MKKIFSIILVVLTLFSLTVTTVFAETTEISSQVVSDNLNSGTNMSSAELTISICVMFAVISLIGVLFIKTVMKNNKNGRLK